MLKYDVAEKLKKHWRKPVIARRVMQHSSIHARTFAGQAGILRGHFVEPEADGSVLAAVSFRAGIAWVDARDLVLSGEGK